MQPGDHRHDDGSPNRVGLMRGVLVIVTAVAIGAFVLSRGLDDSSIEAVAAAGDEVATDDAEGSTSSTLAAVAATTSSTAGSDQTTEAESTTSTVTEPAAPVIRAPADVSVLVLNAAGAKGVAGRGSELLQGAGYGVLAPKNATKLGPTAVLYTENFDAEARAVAEVFGVDPVVVAAYDPASPPINDIRDAIVIVVIGQDGLIDL